MEGSGGERKLVSVLPLRIVYRDGEKSVAIGLNGLAFFLGGGASMGTPVVVSSPRRGDLFSVGGRVTVDSRVDGDVWVMGADAELSPRAVITGDVVVIGGKLLASPVATVGGTVSQLPSLKIPFVGVLGTQFASPAISLGAIAVEYALFGFALFLSAFYLSAHARQMQQSLPTLWRPALITVAISLVVISRCSSSRPWWGSCSCLCSYWPCSCWHSTGFSAVCVRAELRFAHPCPGCIRPFTCLRRDCLRFSC